MIGAPVPLADSHNLDSFSSGYQALDEWLKRRAKANQQSGASRTYVVESDGRVVGYYALAAGSAVAAEAPGKIKRNMPDPIPVMVLGRLAIDLEWQGRGLGADLLRDAVLRTRAAAEIGGIRAIMVHAIDERAAAFYARWGFLASTHRPLTYFLPLQSLGDR